MPAILLSLKGGNDGGKVFRGIGVLHRLPGLHSTSLLGTARERPLFMLHPPSCPQLTAITAIFMPSTVENDGLLGISGNWLKTGAATR